MISLSPFPSPFPSEQLLLLSSSLRALVHRARFNGNACLPAHGAQNSYRYIAVGLRARLPNNNNEINTRKHQNVFIDFTGEASDIRERGVPPGVGRYRAREWARDDRGRSEMAHAHALDITTSRPVAPRTTLPAVVDASHRCVRPVLRPRYRPFLITPRVHYSVRYIPHAVVSEVAVQVVDEMNSAPYAVLIVSLVHYLFLCLLLDCVTQ